MTKMTKMKKKNLNEGRPPSKENRFVKTWLKKYENLKKYKSEDGRFIYLVDDTGQILVSLDTQINETAVSYELILGPLENVIGEKQARRKVIGWLLDNYHLVDMGYVYDAKFSGNSINSGTVLNTGYVQFLGSSINYGTVSGSALFLDNSNNAGIISGCALFADTATNIGGTVILGTGIYTGTENEVGAFDNLTTTQITNLTTKNRFIFIVELC